MPGPLRFNELKKRRRSLPLTARHRSDTNGAIKSRPTLLRIRPSKGQQRTVCGLAVARPRPRLFLGHAWSLLKHPPRPGAARSNYYG